MKLFLILFFSFLIPFSISAQDQLYNPEKYIAWTPNVNLSWDLYKGVPAANSLGHAGTAVKIQAKPYVMKGQIYYHVHALFNKDKSWFKKSSDELLAHEQLHFDIAEVTARMVRKKVEELQKANVNDPKIYKKAINQILINSNILDQSYDEQTLHGILEEEQEVWEEKIAKELQLLEKYMISESNF